MIIFDGVKWSILVDVIEDPFVFVTLRFLV